MIIEIGNRRSGFYAVLVSAIFESEHMRSRLLVTVVLVIECAFSVGVADEPHQKRVPIPSWDNVPAGIFFEDAFVEAIVGTRPSSLKASPENKVSDPNDEQRPTSPVGSEWSKLVSPATIENEMKAIKIEVDRLVTTPSKFRGGGFKEARLHFTIATLLFGITADYGVEVRWQTVGGGARDLFARAAANSKVGDIRAYNEAKLRKADLHDLVSGARLSPPTANPDATWNQLVDRPPLMVRLEIAQQKRLAVWTATDTSFTQHQEQIHREAEIVAAISHVLKQDEMEDAGDEAYEAYCDALKNAALELIQSVKKENAAAARTSVGEMAKACAQCHEDYRG